MTKKERLKLIADLQPEKPDLDAITALVKDLNPSECDVEEHCAVMRLLMAVTRQDDDGVPSKKTLAVFDAIGDLRFMQLLFTYPEAFMIRFPGGSAKKMTAQQKASFDDGHKKMKEMLEKQKEATHA
jgi:hypothetical protein